MYVRIYIYIYTYTGIYIYVYIYTYVYVYINLYIFIVQLYTGVLGYKIFESFFQGLRCDGLGLRA